MARQKEPVQPDSDLPPGGDAFCTIRIRRDVLKRLDLIGLRLGVLTDVPREGVRLSRTFLIGRALDVFEQHVEALEHQRRK